MSFKKYHLLVLSCIFIFSLAFYSKINAQQQLDSIGVLQEIEKLSWDSKADFDKFIQLSEAHREKIGEEDYLNYLKIAFQKVTALDDPLLIEPVAGQLFITYLPIGSDSAIHYGLIAKDYAVRNKHLKNVARFSSNLGLAYMQKTNVFAAIQFFNEVLDLEQSKIDQASIAAALQNMAYCYNLLEQKEEAKAYLRRSLALQESDNSGLPFKNLPAHLAFVALFVEEEQYDSAYTHVRILEANYEQLKAFNSENLPKQRRDILLSQVIMTLCNYYYVTNQLEPILSYYQYYQKIQYAVSGYSDYIELQIADLSDNSRDFFQILDRITQEYPDFIDENLNDILSNYYRKRGNLAKAYEYENINLSAVVDRLKDNALTITAYNDFQAEKRVKDLALLQKKNESIQLRQNNLIAFSITGLVLALLLLIGGAFFTLKRKNKLVKKDLENNQIITQQAIKLAQMNEEKNKLLINIAHEIQTPTSTVLGLTKQIQSNETSTQSTHFDKILNNAHRISESLNNILTLPNLESQNTTLKPESFNIKRFLEDCMDDVEFLANQNEVRISLVSHLSNEFLKQDKAKIELIVRNLLNNAVQYSNPTEVVSLTIDQAEEEALRIAIHNPTVIPSEDLPNLFDRFYQSANADQSGGFGIGLSIVKDCVELLNGRIQVESKAGIGTTFTVSLPVHFIEQTVKPQERTLMVAPLNTPVFASTIEAANQSLLIIEDNQDFRFFLKTILDPHFKLSLVANGAEALAKLEYYSPDLILTDWMMPNINGINLIEQLKVNPQLNDTPIIMLTARNLLTDEIKINKLGIDLFLNKPISKEVLITNIKSLLQKKMPFGNNSSDNFSQLSQKQQEWLLTFEQIIVQNIDRMDFQLAELLEVLKISNSQMNRRIKKLTGFTPNAYITEIRLWESRRLLEEQKVSSVKEAGYSVGFKDIRNFSRNFKRTFGLYPSDILNA